MDDQATETVVEAFVREGKCVATLGASRDSPTQANNDFDVFLWNAVMDSGEVTPGAMVQRAKAMMIANFPNSNAHKLDVEMYMLFGNPAAEVASAAGYLVGQWAMEHDGWQGVLRIAQVKNSRVLRGGAYGYPVWDFTGTYTGQDGKEYAATGQLGGYDPNERNAGAKRSDHKIAFTVAFPGNNQPFEGYVATWTRNTMGGYTWWSNHPYEWSAKKK